MNTVYHIHHHYGSSPKPVRSADHGLLPPQEHGGSESDEESCSENNEHGNTQRMVVIMLTELSKFKHELFKRLHDMGVKTDELAASIGPLKDSVVALVTAWDGVPQMITDAVAKGIADFRASEEQGDAAAQAVIDNATAEAKTDTQTLLDAAQRGAQPLPPPVDTSGGSTTDAGSTTNEIGTDTGSNQT